MIKSLSYKFTNLLINNEIIECEEFEIYRYGFETLIYFIVNISVALCIGIIFDRFIHTVIFLSCYCTLRQFTGGYHAQNYTECTLTFVVIYLITIFIDNNIYMNKYLAVLIFILCGFIIYKLSPLDHRNKPLSDTDKNTYRITIMKIISIIGAIFLFSMILEIYRGHFIYSLFAVFWICILLIVGSYNNNS
ncbi:MAG: accessory gene regulator B family protein [Terrisporobacter sp.]